MTADSCCAVCGVRLAMSADAVDDHPRFVLDPFDQSRCISHGRANLGASCPDVSLWRALEQEPDSGEGDTSCD